MRHRSLTSVVTVLVALCVFTAAYAQESTPGLNEEVTAYYTWQRANPQKNLEESAHPLIKDVYLSDLAAEAVAAQAFPFGEGSILVKERMDPATLSVTNLYVMKKVAGFDPENGDWQYANFERGEDGSFAGDWMTAEGAAMCVGCHVGAANTDYAFLSYLGE